MKRAGLLFTIIFLFVGSAFGQNTGTGVPTFGSFTMSNRDVINNQNLNAHFKFPLVSLDGRKRRFFLSEVSDSTIWVPVTSGSTTSWNPVTNASTWGWQSIAPWGYIRLLEMW